MTNYKKKESSDHGPMWATTFADLTTLLLCFFVIMFALSSMEGSDREKVSKFLNQLSGKGSSSANTKETDTLGGNVSEMNQSNISLGMIEIEDEGQYPARISKEAKDAVDQIKAYIKENQLESDVTVKLTTFGYVIEVKDRILFDSGKATIKNESQKLLNRLSELFDTVPYDISVEGHTDDVKVTSAIYATNWELSTARAVSVVRFFTEDKGLDAKKFSATGYGEWHPAATNKTESGRQMNRRVILKVFLNRPKNL